MPASGSVSSGTSESASSGSFRIEKKKRNRIPLSCTPCRNRKLKCNRSSPCENCVKRNDASSCSYASSNSRLRKNVMADSGSDEMQHRIDRLEGLVLSLVSSQRERSTSGSDSSVLGFMKSNSSKEMFPNTVYEEEEDDGEGEDENDSERQSPKDNERVKTEQDDVEVVRKAIGIMKVDHGGSYFRGETHISAILHEIQEIKQYLSKDKEFKPNAEDLFPFAVGVKLTKPELIELLPVRATMDTIVDNYFSWWDPVFHVIHRPSFVVEYEEFWESPASVDPLWLALLFMIMSLSMKLYCHTGGQPQEFEGRAAEASQNFCHAAEAALVVGEFTKKIYYHYHTLRTLFLMCAGRNHQEQADHTWLLLGWVTRIAMSMGLHRDPEQYKLSPFEIEIRRRLWTQLVCMDLLHSIQSGLPSMMRDGDYDAKEPANLHDHEIGHHLTEQPVPNDLEVMTGVSYMICKSRLSRSYGKIVTQANSTKNRIPYDEVLRLDSELRTAFATLPSFLLYSEARDDSNDPLFLILQRYSLECLFLKAMITLHRPWSCKALDIPRYTPSRTACVKCCTKLLDHQYEIFGEVKGPRLRPISWFIQNTASYDFIHSVIILAIDLWQAWKHKKLEEENDMEYIGTKAKIATLQRTKKIYESAEMIRDECQKALGIIALVLNKIATPYEDSAAKSNGIAPAPDVCQKVARAAPPNSAASGSDLKPNTPFTPYSSSILSRGTTPLSPDSMNTLSTLASNFIDRQQTQTPGGSMVMAEAQANNPISLTPGSNPLQNTFFIPTSPPMFTQFAGLSPVPSTRQVYNDPNYYPGALDWNEWDNFIQGINLDSSIMDSSQWWQNIPSPTSQVVAGQDESDAVVDGNGFNERVHSSNG